MREFDYYIFIDYSENLVGYFIIEKSKVKGLIPKITKFSHYKDLKYKSAYIQSIKKILEKKCIFSDILKIKIKETRQNLEIYSDVLDFLKKHDNCLILISVDNHEYTNFKKLVDIVDGKKTEVVKESELKKGTPEYRMSLILDTLLNIERIKNDNK